MALELEKIESPIRYGDNGPDKFSFIMEGITESDSPRFHEFTINGEKMRIRITSGRRVAPWQCPPHPKIPSGHHENAWADAWEFRGYSEGRNVFGIYSPRSRKGAFYFWGIPINHECLIARHALSDFFGSQGNSDAMLALMRAMDHMQRGSALGGYYVDCKACWELFRRLRQSCGSV